MTIFKKYNNKVINTEYGFYRVAVTNAGKRVVTGDNNATDYKTLTKEVYQLYLDGQELSENIVTGLKYYFIPSIEEIYDAFVDVWEESVEDMRHASEYSVWLLPMPSIY